MTGDVGAGFCMRRLLGIVPVVLLLLVGACAGDGAGGRSDGADVSSGTVRPSRSTSGKIEVFRPTRGQRVGSPFTIEGRAQIFENRVSFRLRTGKNRILATGVAMVDAPDVGQFGSFQGALTWQGVAPGTPGELEVFAVRARDGAPDHVVTIPLILDASPGH